MNHTSGDGGTTLRHLNLGEEYVLEAMNKNPSDIRNIRAYLLTALYNASLTIDNYYSALVNHDFYGQDRSAGLKKPKTYDYSLCEDTL